MVHECENQRHAPFPGLGTEQSYAKLQQKLKLRNIHGNLSEMTNFVARIYSLFTEKNKV